MKLSQLFTKTRKDAPTDEVTKNALLLIQAGFIHKEMAGVYDYLPLGLRVFNNIVTVIREEMNALGAQEIELTALQDPELWKASNRWSDDEVDVWFKTKLQNDSDLGLAFTHEEPISRMMTNHVSSYKDLPQYVYQFQTKFRNEVRSKSGIMRGREFLMKDLYSFSRTQAEHDEFYEKCKQAYVKVFDRLGIGSSTYITFASGGVFSKFSHEFQTITDAGEDIIYVDEDKKIAVNKEVLTDEVLSDLGLDRSKLVEHKAAEVGNIFSLGTKFSDACDLKFTDKDGEVKSVIMGSYGIGPGRTMGVIAETFSDDKGLIWPDAIAPFKVHLVSLGDSEDVARASQEAYTDLELAGIDVLWDDTDARAGEKFSNADLIGIPNRIVVSERSLAAGGLEYKRRDQEESDILSLTAIKLKIK